jgi:MFS family permease
MKLWIGQTLSELGSQISLFALPVTAVLILKAGPSQMGLLGAAQSAPVVLTSLFAGVWVDRLPRRRILIAADLGRAFLLGSVPVGALLGGITVAQLYGVGFLAGTLSVISDVADQAFLPALIGREHLIEAGTKQTVSSSATGIIGPGLAGILVQLLTAPLAVVVDALSYLMSALFWWRIQASEVPKNIPQQRSPISLEIKEGLRFVLGHPLLRPMILSTGILNFCGNMMNPIWLLFAIHDLHMQVLLLGILDALRSGGFLLGALVAPRLIQRFGAGPMMISGVVLMAVAWLPLPLLGGPFLIIFPALVLEYVVSGLGNPLYNIPASSLRQTITPDRLQGRMNASWRFIGRGGMPIGSLCGGVLGSLLGVRPTLALAAGSLLLGVPLLLFSPLPRLREISQTSEEPTNP